MTDVLFAYFGPETPLPLVSAFAAIVGFAVLAGRTTLRTVSMWVRRSFRR
jgi:hypothetical protein